MNKQLLFLILIFLNSNGYTQTNRPRVSVDSIIQWELRKIYHPLGLDSIQAKQFLSAIKNKFYQLDSLKQINTTLPNRKIKIKTINQNFDNKLKIIFSIIQYNSYKIEQQKQSQLFNTRMKLKGIKVEDVE